MVDVDAEKVNTNSRISRKRFRKRRRTQRMEEMLAELERQLLSGDYDLEQQRVYIDDEDYISTVSVNVHSKLTPIVCLHGYCGACAMWLHNIESIALDRPFYAIDLPGFGRSSRCHFSDEPDEIEAKFVDYIEAWRKKMGLEKFVLMGHSFGGYVSSLYALAHPQRVSHLLLVDPWGYVARPPDEYLRTRLGRMGYMIFTKLAPRVNPFAIGRWLGRYGPWAVSKVRPDLVAKFSTDTNDEDAIARYIHYCNAKTPASGEVAFTFLANGLFWARDPLLLRITDLPESIPITFVYGRESWNVAAIAYMVKQLRACSYVDVKVLANAGHHLYADQCDDFNSIVSVVCRDVDKGKWPQYDVTIGPNDATDAPRKSLMHLLHTEG